MQTLASHQLDSIQAMLGAGQRSLRLERHSLVLWGVGFGGLILVSDHVFTARQMPDVAQRALAWLLLMALAAGAISLLDWLLTRRAKCARDEFWSFIHRQVLKVWWLLLGAGVLGTFATFFYGGGYLVFPLWLTLIGLGLFVHGLFSESTLEWAGLLFIALGVCGVTFGLDVHTLQYLAASAIGLGLPLLALLLDRGRPRPWAFRAALVALWLAAVLAPPLLMQKWRDAQQPASAPLRSLQSFARDPMARQTVLLPAGTVVPLHVELSGDTFAPSPAAVLPLTLARPVELLVDHGRLTGMWRHPDKPWRHDPLPNTILIPWIRAELQPGSGPVLRASLLVRTSAQTNPAVP